MTGETPRAVQVRRVTIGLGMMALGAVLLLGRLGWLDFQLCWQLTPLWLVGLGAVRLLVPPHERGGAWLMLVGLLLLAHTLNVLPMTDSWPIFVIAGGISLLFGEIQHRAQARHEQ